MSRVIENLEQYARRMRDGDSNCSIQESSRHYLAARATLILEMGLGDVELGEDGLVWEWDDEDDE